jgi:ABC-type glycerol-3-phosphate transport system substrate-binding protein
MTDWLAQGKFALCLGCRDSEKANKQGLPVDDMDMVDWKEGAHISSGGGSMSLIKGGPHPNAAKVFINWFLSRKGQMALQKYEDLYGEDPPNARRIDIPKDALPPTSRLVEGRRYFDFSEPKYADMTPIYQLAKEFMKGREGKRGRTTAFSHSTPHKPSPTSAGDRISARRRRLRSHWR